MIRRVLCCSLALSASGCFLDAVGLPPEEGGQGGSDTPVAGGAAPTVGGAPQGAGDPIGGEGGAPAECGNSLVETGEGCDSGGAITGCRDCQVEPGYHCLGEPSLCSLIDPVTVSAEFNVPITDLADHYDGSVPSMDCADIVMDDAGYTSIQWVTLEVAVNHAYLGDLIIKLVPPAGTPVATMLSRAAVAEPVDDYGDLTAEGSGLLATSPVTFDDTAELDAELLGSGVVNGVACQDDDICVVRSNPDSAVGNGLADLMGLSPVGTWRVCFADGDDGVAGVASGARLTVLAW